MEVKVNQVDTVTEVTVSGRIDTNTAAEFQDEMSPLLELANPDIQVDCSGLEYISSSGLRVFLMLAKSVDAHAGKLLLKDLQPQVKEVFDITGFSSIIPIA